MRRRLAGAALLLAVIPLSAAGHTRVMRSAHGALPAMAPADAKADLIVVDTVNRATQLMRGDQLNGGHAIDLDATGDGHKAHEGDEKTPDGRCLIEWRKAKTVAHPGPNSRYPAATKSTAASVHGESPGGAVMIKAMPDSRGWFGGLDRHRGRSNGCVALTNAAMQEIRSVASDGTPIKIKGAS